MNILFVYSVDDILTPDKPLRTPAQMQFGISYMSSILKQGGHSTRLIVLSGILGKANEKAIDSYFNEFRPRVACFTTVSTEYAFIAGIARYIKKNHPDTYLLIGGPHVSLNPEEILADGFDALCIGEGEYPALELVSQLEKGETPSRIQNLWIKTTNGIEKNEPRPFLQDLDSLPFPDRGMWKGWVAGEGDHQPVLLGRGCPFECTYCCNHALKKIAQGRYVRFRSTDNIAKEIRGIVSSYPTIKDIYLEVETIGADKEWALDLCRKLKDLNLTLKEPLSFGVNLRIAPNLDFGGLFAAFQKCNITVVNIGVESGSERVRRDILNRRYSNQDIIDVVSLARKHGLRVNFYNLIGVPGETVDDFKKTLEINRICEPDTVYAHIFYPYPGTKLHAICNEKKLLPKTINTRLERCAPVLDLPDFSSREIRNGFVWFDYNVYKGRRPMSKIMAKVFVSKCRSNPYLHQLYRNLTYSFLFKWVKIAFGRYV